MGVICLKGIGNLFTAREEIFEMIFAERIQNNLKKQ